MEDGKALPASTDASDIEKSATTVEANTGKDEDPRDPLLVTWSDESDPSNPKNWSNTRKWTITILTSLGGLVCLMSSTMLAPALGKIAHDFDISQDKANMTLSIFVLAFAFGPMSR